MESSKPAASSDVNAHLRILLEANGETAFVPRRTVAIAEEMSEAMWTMKMQKLWPRYQMATTPLKLTSLSQSCSPLPFPVSLEKYTCRSEDDD